MLIYSNDRVLCALGSGVTELCLSPTPLTSLLMTPQRPISLHSSLFSLLVSAADRTCW